MTFIDDLLLGGARMCYAPADGDGGAGGGDDSSDSGDDSESRSDGAENSGSNDDNDQNNGDTNLGDTSDKSGNSMLDGLEDGDGVKFDFTGEEKPEGFPDEFWDAENKGVNAQALFEGLQKQEKIAKDLRSKMGKGEHKPPEKAADYKLELSEELSALVPSDDPLVLKAQERAHAHGMSQEAFQGFISEIIGDMAEMQAEQLDPNSEANEEARKAYVQEQIKEIGPNGAQVLRAVESWGGELLAEGRISEASLTAMKEEGMVSAPMVRFLNELRGSMGGSSIPIDMGDDGLPPDAEIADMIDKAYESKDAAKIRKTEELLDKRRKAGRPEQLQF